MPLTNPDLTEFTTGDATITSFSFTELLTQRGFLKLSLVGGISALTSQLLFTEEASIESGISGTTVSSFQVLHNANYDTSEFNTTLIAEGVAYLEIGTFRTNTSSVDSRTQLLIELRKVRIDNSEEVIVASTEIFDDSSAGATTLEYFLEKLTIPRTTINRGEKLRLNIQIFIQNTNGTFETSYGTDPINRDGTNIKPTTDETKTNSSLNIPFLTL